MATDSKTSRSLCSFSVAAVVNTVFQFKYSIQVMLFVLWPVQFYNKVIVLLLYNFFCDLLASLFILF